MNNQRFRRLRVLLDRLPFTREGLLWLVVAIALLVMGLVKGINLVTLLACLLMVLVIWNWWEARRQVRRVRAERLEDDPPFAMTPFRWAIQLRNTARRTCAGIEVRDGDGTAGQSWFVTEMAPAAAVIMRGEVTYPRRGPVQGQPLTLQSGHPVGLARVRREAEAARPRVVLPQLGHLHRARLLRFLSRQSPSVGHSRGLPCQAPTAQAEFHGLRPYRPGDSPRHIHWRTTARRGELMIREYEDWPNDDLTLVLEARCREGTGDDPELERAIRLAATICWDWCRQTGDRLLLAIAGGETTVQEGATCRALALQLLERLALESGAATIDTDQVVAELLRRRLPPGPILVIGPETSDLAARLEDALQRRATQVAAGSEAAGEFCEF